MSKPKVLLVGEGLNAEFIKEILLEDFLVGKISVKTFIDKPKVALQTLIHSGLFYFVYITAIPRVIRGLTTLKHHLHKTVLGHVVGTDAKQYFNGELKREKLDEVIRRHRVELIYVSENLRDEMGIAGDIVPIPIKDYMFSQKGEEYFAQKRDVLFYCPAQAQTTYREKEVRQHVIEHPDELVTVIRGSAKSTGDWSYPNVLALDNVEQKDMPKLYRSHRKLIRLTIHDGAPKMIYEALLCGCEVWWNGKQVTSVPPEMFWENGKNLILEKAWSMIDGF